MCWELIKWEQTVGLWTSGYVCLWVSNPGARHQGTLRVLLRVSGVCKLQLQLPRPPWVFPPFSSVSEKAKHTSFVDFSAVERRSNNCADMQWHFLHLQVHRGGGLFQPYPLTRPPQLGSLLTAPGCAGWTGPCGTGRGGWGSPLRSKSMRLMMWRGSSGGEVGTARWVQSVSSPGGHKLQRSVIQVSMWPEY